MKAIYFANTLLLCLAVAMLSACSHYKVAEVDAAAAKIEDDKVTFTTNAPQLAYLQIESAQERKTVANGLSGRLAWDDDVTERVFPPISGRITEIVANPGQYVSAGDVLAKIRSPDFGQAQADARKAAADLNVAERALARTRELFDHGAAAQKDLESVEADYDRARSEKERAMATLSLYGSDGAGDVNGVFLLKALVNGVVVEKSVNPGQEVRSDQLGDKPLFVISDPSRLWLYLDITEAEAFLLSSNQEVVVRSRALPEKTFHGRVEVVGAGLDATTRTLKVRCLIDNPERQLRSEMYVSADVSSPAAGVDVPTKAIFSKNNERYVFIETGPAQFQRRIVRLGIESDGRSEVTGGVAPGQKVVVEGCLLLEAMLEGDNS